MSTVNKVISIRNQGIHISTIMLIGIINRVNTKTGSAFLGEIHAYFHSERKKGKDVKSYTLGGMRAHLKSMRERGLVIQYRDGLCVRYEITRKGNNIIKGLKW